LPSRVLLERSADDGVVAVDELMPPFVPEPYGVGAGLRDLGGQDRGQHGVRRRRAADAGQELLDLTQHEVGVAEVRPVIDRVELEEAGFRDVLGEVAAGLYRRDAITGRMDYQRWHPDRRQRVADVDHGVHAQQVDSVPWACTHLRESRPPAPNL